MGQRMTADYVDVPYLQRENTEFLARIWDPPKGTTVRGVVLDVHGGAWCDRDRRAGSRYDAALAAAGFSVVAIDFRCGPDYQHPAASDDVNVAAHWARLRAERLTGDSDRIISVGSSSGGHLALLAALTAHVIDGHSVEICVDGKWEKPESIDGRVSGVAALWAPVDPFTRYKYAQSLTTDLGIRLVTNTEAYFGSEETMADASISRILTKEHSTQLPTVWFARAGNDENVPPEMVDELARTYRQAGGIFTLKHYADVPHGFGHFETAETQRFLDDLRCWLIETIES